MRFALIAFCLSLVSSNVTAQAEDSFLYVSGYGSNEHDAIVDAKRQLAMNLYSEVEVREKTLISKEGNETRSSYQQEASLRSLPIEIQALELVDSSCQQNQCEYRFRVDKASWVQKLTHDIKSANQVATLKLKRLRNEWRDLKRYMEADDATRNNQSRLIVLAALGADGLGEYQAAQRDLELAMEQAGRRFSVSFTSSRDAFASQLQGLLSDTSLASTQGEITVYIKTSSQSGKKGPEFIAKQNVYFKVFDTASPSVVVSQKVMTELGMSSTSSAAAKRIAQQKIIKNLTNESIYSVLN
jgi:hypothetical protein